MVLVVEAIFNGAETSNQNGLDLLDFNLCLCHICFTHIFSGLLEFASEHHLPLSVLESGSWRAFSVTLHIWMLLLETPQTKLPNLKNDIMWWSNYQNCRTRLPILYNSPFETGFFQAAMEGCRYPSDLVMRYSDILLIGSNSDVSSLGTSLHHYKWSSFSKLCLLRFR
jgi:hypothetical protein